MEQFFLSLLIGKFSPKNQLYPISLLHRYMKGRETLEELNSFLHNTIIRCLTEKYTLAGKQRQVITNQHDILLWKLYDSQMAYFPGKKFITQGDLSTMNRKIIDKKTLSRIQMLRHIQILREERKNSTICYIWLQ